MNDEAARACRVSEFLLGIGTKDGEKTKTMQCAEG